MSSWSTCSSPLDSPGLSTPTSPPFSPVDWPTPPLSAGVQLPGIRDLFPGTPFLPVYRTLVLTAFVDHIQRRTQRTSIGEEKQPRVSPSGHHFSDRKLTNCARPHAQSLFLNMALTTISLPLPLMIQIIRMHHVVHPLRRQQEINAVEHSP